MSKVNISDSKKKYMKFIKEFLEKDFNKEELGVENINFLQDRILFFMNKNLSQEEQEKLSERISLKIFKSLSEKPRSEVPNLPIIKLTSAENLITLEL